MTTITLPRATVEQALETIESLTRDRLFTAEWAGKHGATITNLRAARAQQDDPTDPGHDVDVLREHVRHLERRVRELHAQQDEPETCTWWQDGDSDSDTYSTSCGHYFSITDGTPEDNKMSHCCYCGKKLAQELITEDDDE